MGVKGTLINKLNGKKHSYLLNGEYFDFKPPGEQYGKKL